MSKSYPNATAETLEAIRTDEAVRSDIETLAERDDRFGAVARVVIAIADGDEPSPADCKQAGLESIMKLYQNERR